MEGNRCLIKKYNADFITIILKFDNILDDERCGIRYRIFNTRVVCGWWNDCEQSIAANSS